MKKNEKKNKHMTLDDRIEIQECLSNEMTFKAIGERIGKSQPTISGEVKIHIERLLVDNIVIHESDGKLSINIDLKAAFSSHLDIYDEDGVLTAKAFAAN